MFRKQPPCWYENRSSRAKYYFWRKVVICVKRRVLSARETLCHNIIQARTLPCFSYNAAYDKQTISFHRRCGGGGVCYF